MFLKIIERETFSCHLEVKEGITLIKLLFFSSTLHLSRILLNNEIEALSWLTSIASRSNAIVSIIAQNALGSG